MYVNAAFTLVQASRLVFQNCHLLDLFVCLFVCKKKSKNPQTSPSLTDHHATVQVTETEFFAQFDRFTVIQ